MKKIKRIVAIILLILVVFVVGYLCFTGSRLNTQDIENTQTEEVLNE